MKSQSFLNSPIEFSVGDIESDISQEMQGWQSENKIRRLWERDSSLWTHSDEAEWMGWLDASGGTCDALPHIEALAKELSDRGITDLALLGMGGSSLCPDMFSKVFGKIGNNPRLQILDSTDPHQIRRFESSINLEKTIFIISSKSGNTLEPIILKNYFFSRLQNILNKTEVGDHFIAITDSGTKLDIMARHEHFRAVFYGIPTVGGRLSALSNFGMVPLGLMGIDVPKFLGFTAQMEEACSPKVSPKDNPGVCLGIILGVCAKHGKDKVTLVLSPNIQALGAWITQLLAESTGKNGKGLIPVDQEPLSMAEVYGNDRIFIYLRLESAPNDIQDHCIENLEKLGYAVVRIKIADTMHLGAELFRWQIATAVAGSILGIHPFNQPDVEDSKLRTLLLTKLFEQAGKVTLSPPIFSEKGLQIFADNLNDLALICWTPN